MQNKNKTRMVPLDHGYLEVMFVEVMKLFKSHKFMGYLGGSVG